MIGRGRRSAARTVYKLCSLLLEYPHEELYAAREELLAAVAALPRSAAAEALGRFCAWWSQTSPSDAAAHYVEAIDLDRRAGLYMTFYSDGDRRERGVALLRLRRLYRAAGLPQEGAELPDYLPLMLEFAAAAPGGRGELVLREHRAALELVRTRLREQGSPYGELLEAVALTLGEPSAADRARAAMLVANGPPTELVGLEPFAPPEVVPDVGARR
ncbi:MAG TPA: nitrate reductase molybdenum cofactor assembly chaperone [Solirubrobacteraceae bacterium]|nr:nitrate reductase molybdenum cofactor assembly chaperone [Solirubrobacteraceae bacterium]